MYANFLFKLGYSNFLDTFDAPPALIHLSTHIKTPPLVLLLFPTLQEGHKTIWGIFVFPSPSFPLPSFRCLHDALAKGLTCGKAEFSFERGLSGGCFGVIHVSFAGLLLDRSSATFGIRVQGGNTLIILPALLITGRELTESTCLGVERSFPAALLRQLPFQLNGVLSGYLYGVKRPAGGWGHFYFLF